MDISAVLSQIKQNQIQSFYIFTGEEIEVQWIYIRQIAEHKNQRIKYADDFASIYGKLKNPTLLNSTFCYVLRDDKDILTQEKLWAQLGGTDLPFSVVGNNTLILLLSEVDKRTKFYKYFSDSIIEFNVMPDVMLVKYIKKEIYLSDNNCRRLIEVCESNYGRILLEIDKIKQYSENYNDGNSNEVDPSQVFDWLLKDGTIYQPPKDAIFNFVDAVLRRQPIRAFQLLQESYACGEATMVLLQVLYNNTKQMLQVQSCSSADVCKSTGLTSWQVKCAKDRIGKWRIGELVALLRDIRDVEVGIKTGSIEESNAVDYILVRNL